MTDGTGFGGSSREQAQASEQPAWRARRQNGLRPGARPRSQSAAGVSVIEASVRARLGVIEERVTQQAEMARARVDHNEQVWLSRICDEESASLSALSSTVSDAEAAGVSSQQARYQRLEYTEAACQGGVDSGYTGAWNRLDAVRSEVATLYPEDLQGAMRESVNDVRDQLRGEKDQFEAALPERFSSLRDKVCNETSQAIDIGHMQQAFSKELHPVVDQARQAVIRRAADQRAALAAKEQELLANAVATSYCARAALVDNQWQSIARHNQCIDQAAWRAWDELHGLYAQASGAPEAATALAQDSATLSQQIAAEREAADGLRVSPLSIEGALDQVLAVHEFSSAIAVTADAFQDDLDTAGQSAIEAIVEARCTLLASARTTFAEQDRARAQQLDAELAEITGSVDRLVLLVAAVVFVAVAVITAVVTWFRKDIPLHTKGEVAGNAVGQLVSFLGLKLWRLPKLVRSMKRRRGADMEIVVKGKPKLVDENITSYENMLGPVAKHPDIQAWLRSRDPVTRSVALRELVDLQRNWDRLPTAERLRYQVDDYRLEWFGALVYLNDKFPRKLRFNHDVVDAARKMNEEIPGLGDEWFGIGKRP